MGQASDLPFPPDPAPLPKLMGILNLTPDSFYDGGRYSGAPSIQRRIESLLAEGADIIDIGGESTRPGAAPIPPAEQIRRIETALRHAVELQAVVSLDTTSPEVAEYALERGAQIINDVSCLANPDLARFVARHGAKLILMHARGTMAKMAGFSNYPDSGYEDVVEDVRREWRKARDRAVDQGVAPDQIWFDPGLGFNKNARHSLTLLGRLAEFLSEGVPIVLGASRKSFIKEVHEAAPDERLGGSIAACIAAMKRGASVLRVHDVKETLQALRLTSVVDSISESSGGQHA